MLTRPEEEEESKEGKVGNVLLDGDAVFFSIVDMDQEGEREGSDLCGSRVFLLVFCKLPS